MTMKIKFGTLSGSKYTVERDENNVWWLEANNVPNWGSVPVDGRWEIDEPFIAEGQSARLVSAHYLEFDSPKRIPGGGKITSPVLDIEVIEDE
jgi:hypothetical protein